MKWPGFERFENLGSEDRIGPRVKMATPDLDTSPHFMMAAEASASAGLRRNCRTAVNGGVSAPGIS